MFGRIRTKSAGLCASGVLSLAKSRWKREEPVLYLLRGILPPQSGISRHYFIIKSVQRAYQKKSGGYRKRSVALSSLIVSWPHYSPTFFVQLRESQGKNLTEGTGGHTPLPYPIALCNWMTSIHNFAHRSF